MAYRNNCNSALSSVGVINVGISVWSYPDPFSWPSSGILIHLGCLRSLVSSPSGVWTLGKASVAIDQI